MHTLRGWGNESEVINTVVRAYKLIRLSSLLVIVLLSLSACSAATKTATLLTAESARPTPLANFIPSPTPDYPPYAILLSRVSRLGPLYATADQVVPQTALEAAGSTLAAMLRHRDDLAIILRTKGAFIAVFGHDQIACDISYIRDSLDCKRYTGGWSATNAQPVSGCSERNLLREPDDPFHRGSKPDSVNNCVHVLALTILRLTLTGDERTAIENRYEAAKKQGLWAGDYAMENYEEFFAEMSQCYFSANVAVPRPLHSHGINGPEALRNYDPATFVLLDGIYRGATDLR